MIVIYLFTYRMEQTSKEMKFLPTEMKGFTYSAEKGYTLSYEATGKNAGPLAPYTSNTCDEDMCTPTNSGTCYDTCPRTCVDTCLSTCPSTCNQETCNTCYRTCRNTCGHTCLNTCDRPTCIESCERVCWTWDTCYISCAGKCE